MAVYVPSESSGLIWFLPRPFVRFVSHSPCCMFVCSFYARPFLSRSVVHVLLPLCSFLLYIIIMIFLLSSSFFPVPSLSIRRCSIRACLSFLFHDHCPVRFCHIVPACFRLSPCIIHTVQEKKNAVPSLSGDITGTFCLTISYFSTYSYLCSFVIVTVSMLMCLFVCFFDEYW